MPPEAANTLEDLCHIYSKVVGKIEASVASSAGYQLSHWLRRSVLTFRRAVLPRVIDIAKTRRIRCYHRGSVLVANVFVIFKALNVGHFCDGSMHAVVHAELEWTFCQGTS